MSSQQKPIKLKSIVAKSERRDGETAADTRARQAACKHGPFKFFPDGSGYECATCGKTF